MLCFLSGIAVLLYHPVSGWMSQRQMKESVAEFEQGKVRMQAPDAQEDGSGVQQSVADLLTDMLSYNEALYESGQTGLADAWSYEQPIFDLTEYGLTTDVAGVLDIPAMGEKLPVYLGATEENMAKGVAVLGQTSMPVGGANTNCVIAGHRGYGGAAFFREIERLQPGDPVYLTTYWGERIYRVESTAVILPDDMEAVLIREGKELLTLITCHPYAEATHRYAVYCAIADDPSQDVPGDSAQIASGMEKTGFADREPGEGTSGENRMRLEERLPFLAIPLVLLAFLILLLPQKKKKRFGKEERRK